MAVPALSAARSLCELRNWTISNLELQKILYLAHMIYMGEYNGAPLIHESFEAWDYGPVVPEVYQHVKGFGNGPIRNVFHWIDPVPDDSTELAILRSVVNGTKTMRAGQLVANTHRVDGAWAHAYLPHARGVIIENKDILDEYRRRVAAA